MEGYSDKKIILLNGPKGCGKTDLTNHLHNELGACYIENSRCKDRLFELTQQFFNVTPNQFWDIYNDRDLKELPNQIFAVYTGAAVELAGVLGGNCADLFQPINPNCIYLSIRQAMIYVSEVICKPTFGSDYFGVFRANKVAESNTDIHIDDSCFGTMDEITPVINDIGIENVLLVRIHGRGDFEGDSRRYLEDDNVPESMSVIDLQNDGELIDFLDNGFQSIKYWIVKGSL